MLNIIFKKKTFFIDKLYKDLFPASIISIDKLYKDSVEPNEIFQINICDRSQSVTIQPCDRSDTDSVQCKFYLYLEL